MRALIVYESMFGNTEKIARAVAGGLAETAEVTLADVRDRPAPRGADLLVLGAPTHAWSLSRPASRADAARQGRIREGAAATGLREFLEDSPALMGICAAAFTTGLGNPVSGSAARAASRRLRRLGSELVAAPRTFRVVSATGPLLDGEVEKATNWARHLAGAMLTRHPA